MIFSEKFDISDGIQLEPRISSEGDKNLADAKKAYDELAKAETAAKQAEQCAQSARAKVVALQEALNKANKGVPTEQRSSSVSLYFSRNKGG